MTETVVPWWIGKDAGGSAVKVYVAIEKLQTAGEGASVRALCEASGLSVVTVQKALKELRGLGAIRAEQRVTEKGARLANYYELAGQVPLDGVATGAGGL
jgi:DNA-binding transcriptional MocR family regulator